MKLPFGIPVSYNIDLGITTTPRNSVLWKKKVSPMIDYWVITPSTIIQSFFSLFNRRLDGVVEDGVLTSVKIVKND